MRVVVDTNVVFRAFLSRESPIWRDLLQPATPVTFFSPRFLSVEIEEHWDRICTKSWIEAEELVSILMVTLSLFSFMTSTSTGRNARHPG
jgi:predicted nucleic acid-binding protein